MSLRKSEEWPETKGLAICMAQKSAQEYQNKRVINLFVSVSCKIVRNLLKQKDLEKAFVAARAKECASD